MTLTSGKAEIFRKALQIIALPDEEAVDAMLDPAVDQRIVSEVINAQDGRRLIQPLLQRSPLPERILRTLLDHPNRFLADRIVAVPEIAIDDVLAFAGIDPREKRERAGKNKTRIRVSPRLDEPTLGAILRARPEINAEFLRRLMGLSNDARVLIRIAACDKADAKLLSEIVETAIEGKRRLQLLREVAQNENADDGTLRRIVACQVDWTTTSVIDNPATSPELLAEISENETRPFAAMRAGERLKERLASLSAHDRVAFTERRNERTP
jgi:hypothetical protein